MMNRARGSAHVSFLKSPFFVSKRTSIFLLSALDHLMARGDVVLETVPSNGAERFDVMAPGQG
jgi:hypothetical protein